MIGLLQRVQYARVLIASHNVAAIEQGLVVLLGLERADDLQKAQQLVDRLLSYRVFADEHDRMNRSLQDIQAGLLLVPQFTLAADTANGKRPSFSTAMPPDEAKVLFLQTCNYAMQQYPSTVHGKFGADMQVELCNDGPVTFSLKV